YRVSTQASKRAILGVSRGGVWSLEIGMRHPDNFNIVAALSPALSYNHPRAAYDPFDIARTAERVPDCILISSGDREPQFSDEIDRFAETLERSGVDFIYLQHEGRHENSAWQTILERVLIFVAKGIREIPNGCS
ncbi:MAG: alpha/beta hydrolase-fold protein, partial [Anaerolineales bacterium]